MTNHHPIRKHYLSVIYIILAITLIPLAVTAKDGGITPEAIESMRSSFEMNTQTRAAYNAVTGNDINGLALNRDLLNRHNTHFNLKLDIGDITDQKSSGRCWLFASLNILRPTVMKKHNLKNFEFSQNYLAFWDKLEKANCFLEYIIEFRDLDPLDRKLQLVLEHPCSDGGYWSYTTALIKKYGAAPKAIMPETHSSGKTGLMNRVVKTKLRQSAAILRRMHQSGKSIAELRAEKERVLAEIYHILVLNLGEPPTEFTWRYETKDSSITKEKTYTPKSFFEDFVDENLDDYVSVFNNPTKPYGQHYICVMSRNMYDDMDFHYANADIEKLRQIAVKSLMAGDPVVFSCDVSKDQERKKGILALDLYDYGTLFNTDLSMPKKDRALYFESSSNHMMTLVAIDTADGEVTKWLVENSWGDDDGDKGYWTMYNDWFDMFVYDIIVKKRYVHGEVMDVFQQKPIPIPPWDPMTRMIREW